MCISDDEGSFDVVDWLFAKNNDIDLRLFYLSCNTETHKWELNVEWGECQVNLMSPVSKRPVCFTTEAN